MRLHSNSLSKVGLSDVLRRRRSNLSKFLKEMGIVTYDLLVERCNSMGVVPPPKKDFYAATGRAEGEAPVVSSPTEGVIVLDPPVVLEAPRAEDPLASEDHLATVEATSAVTPSAEVKKKKKQKAT